MKKRSLFLAAALGAALAGGPLMRAPVLFSPVAAQAAPAQAAPAQAAVPEDTTRAITVDLPGPAGLKTSAFVALPSSYLRPERKAWRYPVFYLLHGFGGHYMDWPTNMAKAGEPLTYLADRYDAILVAVEGNAESWYVNAPATVADSARWQWDTYVTRTVRESVDARFRTWRDRRGRGLAGLSMGGHGSLLLAMKHPDLYGAACSMSGVVDITRHPSQWNIAQRLGPYEQNRDLWAENSILRQADRFRTTDTALMLDCGVKDFTIAENRELHQKFLDLGVDHDYVERPGEHNWQYWPNALPYDLLFLSRHLRPAGAE